MVHYGKASETALEAGHAGLVKSVTITQQQRSVRIVLNHRIRRLRFKSGHLRRVKAECTRRFFYEE
jgi:hypothetical protein